jgi:hypothetical protein
MADIPSDSENYWPEAVEVDSEVSGASRISLRRWILTSFFFRLRRQTPFMAVTCPSALHSNPLLQLVDLTWVDMRADQTIPPP